MHYGLEPTPPPTPTQCQAKVKRIFLGNMPQTPVEPHILPPPSPLPRLPHFLVVCACVFAVYYVRIKHLL